VKDVAWSPNGSTLAVLYNDGEDRVGLVDWPTLTQTPFISDPAANWSLVALSGGTPKLYLVQLAQQNGGTLSIDEVNSSGPVSVIVPSSDPVEVLRWTPNGLYRVGGPRDATTESLWLTDASGHDQLVWTRSGVVGFWVSADAQWTVEQNYVSADSSRFVVDHAGSTVSLDGPSAQLLGMTPDHTALVMRTPSEDGSGGTLRLSLLPISGGAIETTSVSVAFPSGVWVKALSDQGVLAYEDPRGRAHQLCMIPIDFGRAAVPTIGASPSSAADAPSGQ
jgi:WD40 repeat protein